MQRPLNTLSTPDHTYRRLVGLALGAALGLTYGLISQLINRALLPGIAFYQPPFGPIGNIALAILCGALLGLISAWAQNGTLGAFLAATVCAVVILIGSFIQARPADTLLAAMIIAGVFLALPFWGMLVPFAAGLRWGVNRLDEARRDRTPLLARVPPPLVLILLVAAAGVLSLYRPEARSLLAKTDTLLQTAQRASSADALPEPLRASEAGPVIVHVREAYTLAWEKRDIVKYRIPRPGRNFDDHSVVVARFADGWNLVCLYITPDETPLCRGFEELPQ